MRQLAERHPEEALLFWSRWADLAVREQEWLLSLTARHNPDLSKAKLRKLLEAPLVPPFVVTLAVEHQLELPAALLEHEDSLVRAAAIFQGHADDKLERYLSTKASVGETLAALHRCEPKRLVDCLGDVRWQVRGEASRLLCQLENPPLEEIRLKSESEELGTKVAAFTVLEWYRG